MVRLANVKYDSSGVLIISSDELEAFAYRQLSDYQKGYFKEPHPLDIDDFVENYLKIRVDYHTLSLNNGIYGATALADGVLPILDSGGQLSIRKTKKGQVFVDCGACRNCETTIRFTLAHESGHSQFDCNVDLRRLNIVNSIADTHDDLFGKRAARGGRTPREWMEFHANRYAVCLLMPKRFVHKLWKKYHAAFFSGKRITSRMPKRLWLVISKIAEDLCVAKSSIALRLLELNIISKEMFESLNTDKWETKQ